MSTKFARALRRQSTWAERRLWKLLRARRFAGYKFRRQVFESGYYSDFFCVEARLVIELDGGGHGHPENKRRDAQRDAFLASRGILVKRVWNRQLATAEARQTLLSNLWTLLQERVPHPGDVAPPPHRRLPDKSAVGENQRSPSP